MEYFNGGYHPLQLKLERSEGVVGVVIADIAPFGTITARSRVRVQLDIAIGHVGRHCNKKKKKLSKKKLTVIKLESIITLLC